ncbi:vitamin B12 ABC transporter substrate-binding protein BtuF [Erwinia sp. 9145]|uniref:vitamin B12 ABC transporter substrate-binding protein BtuF n=1 Tax=Erwinia sp. 9145 TaxID=1500895 RepID=UPI000551A46C|nr:vitamin B12 ABC transporter substrate-binding protein BtuF [Erwinia sp. 9145]
MAKWLAALLLLSSLTASAAPVVITLAPNLTELAFAAGITPVGVSSNADFPPGATQIEQVADWQGINVERIMALRPDLVLAWRGGNPQRQVEQLQAFGIQVEWIDPETIEQVIATLRRLKIWSPQPEKADRAARSLENQLAALRQRYGHAPRKAVFLQFGQQPLFTASRNTLQNQVLDLCGGDNIFADARVAWPQVSREQVLMRHPAAIVTGGDANHAASVRAFWRSQLNVPVIAINEDWISRAGPRIVLAAQALCQQLHAEPEEKTGKRQKNPQL